MKLFGKRYFMVGIILLMAVALGGIITIQIYWITTAVTLKQEQIDRSVNEALNHVVENLQSKQTVEAINRQMADLDTIYQMDEEPASDTQKSTKVLVKKVKKVSNRRGVKTKVLINTKKRNPNGADTLLNNLVTFKHLFLDGNPIFEQVKDSLRADGFLLSDSGIEKTAFENGNRVNTRVIIRKGKKGLVAASAFNFSLSVSDSIGPDFNYSSDFKGQDFGYQLKPNFGLLEQGLPKKQTLKQRKKQIAKVVNKVVVELQGKGKPANARLDLTGLDSLLDSEFKNRQIEAPFEFAVLKNKSISGPHSPRFKSGEVPVNYAVKLFPDDIFGSSEVLAVQFFSQTFQVIQSLGWLLAASLFFTLIILAAFVSSILIILKQKKISDVKSDFINNMSHEFKTPIATISLATDAIENPLVSGSEEKIRFYTGLIRVENRRMNSNVERVLQMAQLEQQKLVLELEPVNLYKLLGSVIGPMQIQAEQRNGKISLQMENQNLTVRADEHHLKGVIFNLLDNAMKYSPNDPEIKVEVITVGNFVRVMVIDKGIGLSEAARRRVFDKFYRVQKGNIHNVKGFGLGLAYSKAVIEAHGGSIWVQSETGKGSTFTIQLPINT